MATPEKREKSRFGLRWDPRKELSQLRIVRKFFVILVLVYVILGGIYCGCLWWPEDGLFAPLPGDRNPPSDNARESVPAR